MVRAVATILLAAILAANLAVAGGARPLPTDGLYQLEYLYGVAIECGLADNPVTRGFLLEAGAIVGRLGLSETTMRAVRIRAWVAVDREWSNRGLGGYRNWCRTEGEGAAARFRAASDANPPD